MKKILLLTCSVLFTSTIAYACGGITIKSKYCLSKHTMNWYAAYAWCHDQGMDMIDLNSACGSRSKCSALQLSESEQNGVGVNGTYTDLVNWVWTKDSRSASAPWSVQLVTGAISSDRSSWGERNANGRALCQ